MKHCRHLMVLATLSLATADPVSVWRSSEDGHWKLSADESIHWGSTPTGQPGPNRIEIQPDTLYQKILGLGVSFDHASCYNLSQLPPQTRAETLRRLFHPQDGIGMNLMRVCIGTSDFTGEPWYTYNDLPPGETDPEVDRFTIERDRAYVLPIIKAARAVNPHLMLYASPWSPPAWMKSEGSLLAGRLKPEWYPAYARYLLKFVRAYADEGLPVGSLSGSAAGEIGELVPMASLRSAGPWLPSILLGVIIARWVLELVLARLNDRHTLAHAREVPEPFRSVMDFATYRQSVRYTLAKSRFGQLEDTFTAGLLAAILISGALPWIYHQMLEQLGRTTWSVAAVLLVVPLLLAIVRLPFDWAAQFGLEERFGFNTTTPRTWWVDRIKGFALSLVIGFPLLGLIVGFHDWAGSAWWLWAWAALVVVQLLLMIVAPVLILPLFNRLTPLPEGSLRHRLHELARRTRFRHRGIFVMDGSRRSRHSNAFFTGLGRFRRIVLYDTLVADLQEDELEAVLAHEIGHYRLGHIPRSLAASAGASFAIFWFVGRLADQAWFSQAFAFQPGGIGPVLLLGLTFGGAFSFWLSPLWSLWSRRFEYQADRFAAELVGNIQPMVQALRKLTERNLSNLTPHKIYSWFYYSHPTLWEREQALQTKP